jgi:hypothetical protein
MRRIIAAAAVLLASVAATGPAMAQSAANTREMARDANGNVFYLGINDSNGYYTGVTASQALTAPTTSGSVQITTGLTYQTIFTPGATGPQELTFINNQDSGDDICFIIFGQNIASQITPGTTTTSTNLTINGNIVPAGADAVVMTASGSAGTDVGRF